MLRGTCVASLWCQGHDPTRFMHPTFVYGVPSMCQGPHILRQLREMNALSTTLSILAAEREWKSQRIEGCPWWSMGKNPLDSARDMGSIPGSGRLPHAGVGGNKTHAPQVLTRKCYEGPQWFLGGPWCCEGLLVVRWLRICFAMQGTPVWPLVQEDPTCHGATKPVCHQPLSLWVTNTEIRAP